MQNKIKRQKVIDFLSNLKTVISDFLLRNINQLNESDLDDLLVLLDGGKKDEIKRIFEKRKSRIIKNLSKVKQLAKKVHNLSNLFKRKKFYG